MPEWLTSPFGDGQALPVATVACRLGLALLLGGAVAALYVATHRRDESLVWSFVSTLVLLAVLIAMVTQVIGDSVARAFSLVGALSIVRFRTVVEDTRDTAFVIFAVVVGMAAGVGHPEVALLGLVVVGLACVVLQSRRPTAKGGGPYCDLSVRVGLGLAPEDVLGAAFSAHFDEVYLVAAATGRQGAAIDVAYRVRLRAASRATAVVCELNLLDGVQSVELRCP